MVIKKKKRFKEEQAKKRSLAEILNSDPLRHPTRTSSSGKKEASILFLGELALGTKACDSDVYKGLAYAIKANPELQNVGHVLIGGGLLPYIPTYYGIQNAREMVFLGNDWDREIDERTKLVLQGNLDKESREFIEKWVAYKITNTSQAVSYSRKALEPLVEVLREAVWHYQPGEEDEKNIEALTEININNYMDFEKNRLKDLEKKANLEQQLEKLRKEESSYHLQSKLLREAKQQIPSSHDQKKISQYLNKLIKEKVDAIELMENPEMFVNILSSFDSRSSIIQKVNEIDEELKRMKRETKEKEREFKDTINAINAQKREEEAPQVMKFLKRRAVQADETEFLRWEAKNEYKSHLDSVLPGVDFRPHSGNELELLVDGRQVLVMHKVGLSTNVPGSSELKKMKEMVKELNQQGFAVPQICATYHGAEGFRMEPMPANSETIENYVERGQPKVTMLMQIPTMQSAQQLRTLLQKGIKNVHTRRYEKGNFSSGAIFYTVRETGEEEVVMLTTETLLAYAQKGEQVLELKKQEQTINSRFRKKKEVLKQEIGQKEEELRLYLQKGTVITDCHLGCPNKEGRPSNYEVLESAKNYLEKTGLPDLLVLNGDIVHGALVKHFGSNEQHYARLPYQVSKRIAEIKESEADPLQKLADLEHFCTREMSQMVPLPLISQQFREVKMRLVPLMQAVLEKGGYVLVTSGNHPNETTRYVDEATSIVNLVDSKYVDNPHLQAFVGLGEKSGMGEITLENGWKVYCAHEPKRASDHVLGILRQIKGCNRVPNLAVYGHVHHPGGGQAGQSYFIIGAGMQPHTPLLDRIGVQASLRGIVNFEYDPQQPGFFKWKFVLDPTLEHPLYKKKG